MENEDKNREKPPQRKTATKKLEDQVLKFTDSLNKISEELESIKKVINKRKSENVTLKVLMYTGIVVLLLGFLYTSSTLQRAQLESLESNIMILQSQFERDLLAVQSSLSLEIEQHRSHESSRTSLPDILDSINMTLTTLEPENENVAALVEEIKSNSEALSQAYMKSKEPPAASEELIPLESESP